MPGAQSDHPSQHLTPDLTSAGWLVPCPLLWLPPKKGQALPHAPRPFENQASSLGAFRCSPPLPEQRPQGTELWPQSTGPRTDGGLRDRVYNRDCKSVHPGASRTLHPASKPRTPVGRISVAGPGARDSGAGPGARRVRSRALRPSPPTHFLKGVWWPRQEPGSARGCTRGGGAE